jgi:xanthine dehydrogenase accessory factor
MDLEPRIACITHADFPVDAWLAAPGEGALAILLATEGPAYRPAGAAMVLRDGRVVAGTLSSGCVENDVAKQAEVAQATGVARRIRYGAGSPYFDVRLPCGGSLDLVVLPSASAATLERLAAARTARREIRLAITADDILLDEEAGAGVLLRLRIIPDIAFHVFGKGPEAAAFAELAAAAGYDTDLTSPDPETLAAVKNPAVRLLTLGRDRDPAWERFDRHSAVVLFFHDHDWEPRILAAAAASEAFYIGAQGGRRTRDRRDEELRRLGVPDDAIAAMKGPAGLFAGARDPRTLAISVLSEVVAEAERRRAAAERA